PSFPARRSSDLNGESWRGGCDVSGQEPRRQTPRPIPSILVTRNRRTTTPVDSLLQRTSSKNLMLFSGRAHPTLAEEVADLLEVSLVPTTAYDFSHGEIYVRFDESMRGSDAFVIHSHAAPV